MRYRVSLLLLNFSFFHKALIALQYHQYQVHIQINDHKEFHHLVELLFLLNITLLVIILQHFIQPKVSQKLLILYPNIVHHLNFPHMGLLD